MYILSERHTLQPPIIEQPLPRGYPWKYDVLWLISKWFWQSCGKKSSCIPLRFIEKCQLKGCKTRNAMNTQSKTSTCAYGQNIFYEVLSILVLNCKQHSKWKVSFSVTYSYPGSPVPVLTHRYELEAGVYLKAGNHDSLPATIDCRSRKSIVADLWTIKFWTQSS